VWDKNNFIFKKIDIAKKYPVLTLTGMDASKQYLADIPEVPTSKTQTPSAEPPLYYSLDFLDISHKIYHKDMNRLFACGMLNSRMKILWDITDNINKRFGNGTSEIVKKIEVLTKRMEAQASSLSCGNVQESPTSMRLKLLDSATYEYCTYRYYLDYVDRNVNNNLAEVKKQVDAVRKTTKSPQIDLTNSVQAADLINRMNREVADEIAAAKRTYPVALAGFVEMERTYSVHILLLFIQDDYLVMRENLKNFLNPISQLFYKILNAQSANNG
jgi:hypothetical protein